MRTPNTVTILGKINAQLNREVEEGLADCERLLREYLIMCLNRINRRLIRGQISLPDYYRETQLLACCAERLNDGDE